MLQGNVLFFFLLQQIHHWQEGAPFNSLWRKKSAFVTGLTFIERDSIAILDEIDFIFFSDFQFTYTLTLELRMKARITYLSSIVYVHWH